MIPFHNLRSEMKYVYWRYARSTSYLTIHHYYCIISRQFAPAFNSFLYLQSYYNFRVSMELIVRKNVCAEMALRVIQLMASAVVQMDGLVSFEF